MTSKLPYHIYIFFILSTIFSSMLFATSIPNREMIILQETINAENLDITLNAESDYLFEKILHPTGIGALTVTFLIALQQEAAPIIANRSLVKNVIDHQNLYRDFINLNPNALYKKYGRYKRFQKSGTLENFKTNCRYMQKSMTEINNIIKKFNFSLSKQSISKELEKIVNDRRFHLQFAPDHIRRLSQNKVAIEAFLLEMVVYTLCDSIEFNNWIIREVNEDTFLLVPKSYFPFLKLKNQSLAHKPLETASPKLTNLEIELGLKIDHMQEVKRSAFEQKKKIKNSPGLLKSLEYIFVTETDRKNHKLPETNKVTWSLYLAGHGLPTCAPISVLPQLHELKKLSQKKLKNPKFKSCEAYENHKRSNQSIDKNHLSTCSHHASYRRHNEVIKKLDQEIKRAEPYIHSTNQMDHGMIACLSINDFRDLLKFFNNAIDTTFLHYTSCFAGGAHLIEPYGEKDESGEEKKLIFNYPIVSGTPAENMALQEFPFINLPPYTKIRRSTMLQPSDMEIADIDLEKKRLKLHTTLQFNKFFKALRKGVHNNPQKLLLATYSLHPHIDKFGNIEDKSIPNIPLIRLAHSDHFQPIPHDTSSLILNEQNSTVSITINKEATLLYTDYISGKITLNKLSNNSMPRFVSMLPGFALHIFEEISSSSLNLNDIINSFLTFPELGSSKIFWIKKLECTSNNNPHQKKTHRDVIIMRNVFTTNSIEKSSHYQPAAMENCAYFLTSTNQKAKLTWNSPFIEDHNYRVNFCDQSDHTDDCLHFFPKMAQFLNHLLPQL